MAAGGPTAAKAAKRGPGARIGHTYLHSAVDGFSRLAYTESLDDEKAATTIAFFCRARAFFAAHGVTRIHRVVTDNGANYAGVGVHPHRGSAGQQASADPSLHAAAQRQGRALQPVTEVLYACLYANEQARREAIGVWVNHFNYYRPPPPATTTPASRTPTRVNNVTPSYI